MYIDRYGFENLRNIYNVVHNIFKSLGSFFTKLLSENGILTLRNNIHEMERVRVSFKSKQQCR